MEEALDEIYKGRCNVAVKAKEIGVSTEELKRLFRVMRCNALSMRMFARRRGARLALGLNPSPP